MSSHQPISHREEYARKKRRARLIKFGLVLLLFLVVFFGLVLLSRINRFRISMIHLSGNVLVSEDDVSKTVDGVLSGNYIWFFPKNNFLLYPHNELEGFLKDKYQRINNISINVNNFKYLNIAITERNLNALWCDGLAETNLPENCYFLDNTGLIFASAPYFSGDAYFKYYGLVSTSTSPVGLQYIKPISIFKDLWDFIHRAQDLSLHPIYLLAQDGGQFTVGLSGGGHIYIDTKVALSKTGDNLQALLGTISVSTTFSAQNIDYIDLRFGNKLFYKLK